MASNYNLNPVPWHPMFGGPEWATPAPFQAPSFNAGGAQQPFNPITGPGIPFPEGPSMLWPSQGDGGGGRVDRDSCASQPQVRCGQRGDGAVRHAGP